MKNHCIKNALLLILFLFSSNALATQYTNFNVPSPIPSGLQNGEVNFSYSWGQGYVYCKGPASYLLDSCLSKINDAINTASFNGQTVFGTAHMQLICRNKRQSTVDIGPNVIQQPNQWITLAIPDNCA